MSEHSVKRNMTIKNNVSETFPLILVTGFITYTIFFVTSTKYLSRAKFNDSIQDFSRFSQMVLFQIRNLIGMIKFYMVMPVSLVYM